MHMLVGFLMTRLLSRKRPSGEGLPSVRGVFEVAHHLPGRTRFRISMLAEQETKVCHLLAEKVRELPGVRKVDVTPLSGSIVVVYDDRRLPAPVLCGALVKLTGLAPHLEGRPESVAQKEMRLAGDSLAREVHDATFGVLDANTALGLSILLLGLYKTLALRQRSLPEGPVLLWWAFMILRSGK
jgi:hypothetical protein